MPIPAFNKFGVLPPGVWACTLEEAGARFGVGSHVRADHWKNFLALLDWIRPAGVFAAVYIDGSFVTDKPEPGDIDAILEWTTKTREVFAPLRAIGATAIFDDADQVRRRFGHDVFPWRPGHPNPAQDRFHIFQMLRTEEAIARGMTPPARRGILMVNI